MGAWGPGLYSNDFALDLRSTLKALARLPFDGDRILEIARESMPEEANDSKSTDYPTFWLVLADQFHKRGIASDRPRDVALAIIDSGVDATNMRELGMSEANLQKRSRKLSELRTRLLDTPPGNRSPQLNKPQTFILDIGDVFIYPVLRGDAINPYFPDYRGKFDWKPDAWASCIILNRGRAFDFFSWYTILTAKHAMAVIPPIADLKQRAWVFQGTGTCSRTHLKKLEFERIGTVNLDAGRIHDVFGELPDGTWEAAQDISIANRLGVVPDPPSRTYRNWDKVPTTTLCDLCVPDEALEDEG